MPGRTAWYSIARRALVHCTPFVARSYVGFGRLVRRCASASSRANRRTYPRSTCASGSTTRASSGRLRGSTRRRSTGTRSRLDPRPLRSHIEPTAPAGARRKRAICLAGGSWAGRCRVALCGGTGGCRHVVGVGRRRGMGVGESLGGAAPENKTLTAFGMEARVRRRSGHRRWAPCGRVG